MWFFLSLLGALLYSLLWVFARMSRGVPSTVVTAAEFVTAPLLLAVALRTVDYPWGETWFRAYLIFPFLLTSFFMWLATFALHRAEVTILKPLFGLSSVVTLGVVTGIAFLTVY